MGICASGAYLTPVLITSDQRDTEESGDEMRILYFKDRKGPGTDTTKAWFDIVKEEMGDRCLLLCDNLRSYFNRDFQDDLKLHNAELKPLPAAAGAWMNPCDNAFNHELKQHYRKCSRGSHAEMVAAIRESFHAIPDAHVVSYFRHCGIIGDEDPKKVAARLCAEGYWRTEENQEKVRIYSQAYNKWHSDWLRRHDEPTSRPSRKRIAKSSSEDTMWETRKKK